MKVTLDLGLPCMVSKNFEIKIFKKKNIFERYIDNIINK